MRALPSRASLLTLVLGLTPLAAEAGPDATYALEVRDQHGAPLEHAVVTLHPEPSASPTGATANAAPAVSTATMDQRNKQFVPHVLAVQRGTSVLFPNSDDMRHHVYSFSPAKRFELELYSGLPPRPIVFDQVGEVVLGCNIHDHMIGYIYVVDSPHFAVTGGDGVARFTELPAGRFRVELWHPDRAETPPGLELELRPADSRREARSLRVRHRGSHASEAAAHGAP